MITTQYATVEDDGDGDDDYVRAGDNGAAVVSGDGVSGWWQLEMLVRLGPMIV